MRPHPRPARKGLRTLAWTCGLALACSAPPGPEGPAAGAPRWLADAYAHPQAQRSSRLCAVGVAPGIDAGARDVAVKRAMGAMISEILVQVRAEIQVEAESRHGSGGSFWEETLREDIAITSSGELPGVQVVERWQDPLARETYVLAAVQREHLLDLFLPAVDQAQAAAVALLDATDTSGDPAQQLMNTLSAHGRVASTYADATKAKVVAAGSASAGRAGAAFARSSALLAQASERLATLAASVRIAKSAGDGQRGAPRGALPQELEATFVCTLPDGRQVPLVGFPVRFRLEDPGAASLAVSAVSTDAQGIVRCRVTDLLPTGRSSNRVIVEADPGQLGAQLPPARFPSEAFVYWLPTPGQTAIAVAVASTYSGAAFAAGTVAEDLAGHLSVRGFDVTAAADLGQAPLAELESRFQYLIRGSANAWYSSQEATLHYFKAKAQLEIVELASGRVQALTTKEFTAGSSDRSEQGAVRALRTLRKPLLEALDAEFVALFVPDEAAGG